MKKKLCYFMVTVLGISMLAGCAGGGEEKTESTDSDATTITVWVNGGEDAFIPSLLADFNAEYPDINVDMIFVPQSDCHQKIMTTIASGGELPDIVDSTYDNFGQLKELDLWENMEAEPYNLDRADLAEFILPALEDSNGNIVALPGDNGVSTIVYDRDLAEEYLGTSDVDEIEALITSQDKIVEIAKDVQEKSNGTVYAFASVNDAYTCSFSMNNKEAFVVDGKLNIDPSIGEAYRFVADLMAVNGIDSMEQYSDDWYNNFSESTTLFYSCPQWFVDWNIINNDMVGGGRWGMMKPPVAAYEGGEMYLIPKASDPEKKEAAFTLLKWLCASQEGAEAFMKNTKLINLYAANMDEDNEVFQTEREEFAGEKVYQKFMDVLRMDSMAVRPVTPYDSSVISSGMGQLPDLAQGMSAEEAIQNVTTDILTKYPELSE